MTDKQIIIDGVDVNSLYHDQITCMNRYEVATLFIKTVELLVAKEQECERLKDIIETKLEDANICDTGLSYLNDEYIFVKRQLDQLKAENEELKNFHINLVGVKECEIKELLKLKQTLTEIKEIAENREIFCENCGGGVESFTCDDCGYVKILQKISECEVGND